MELPIQGRNGAADTVTPCPEQWHGRACAGRTARNPLGKILKRELRDELRH
jgi:hypothetical protein